MDALEFRFAFYARDFEQSVHFYRDVLGLKYVSGWDRPDGKGALLSAGGTAVVEIYGAAAGESYSGPPPIAINLALKLADTEEVDRFFEQLASLGARLPGPPQDRPWGHRAFIVADPDDIPIHIYSELKPG